MTNNEAIKYLKQLYPNGGHCWLDEQRIEAIGMAVKALQEEPVSMWHDANEEQPEEYRTVVVWNHITMDGEVITRCTKVYKGRIWAYIEDLLNFSNVERTVKNWKEIPVSEDLEKASKEWLRQQLDKSYANYGEAKMMELTHFDGYAMLDAIEFGAQWQKKRDYIPLSDNINEVARQICNKVLNCEIDYKEDDVVLSDEEECVKAGIRWQMQKEAIPSKDLEELINSLSKQFPEVSFAKLSRIAARVAKWQKEQFEKNRLEH